MTTRKDPAAATFDRAAHSVLIVDDENSVRSLLARWLESGGFRVTTAGSAEEAPQEVETEKS